MIRAEQKTTDQKPMKNMLRLPIKSLSKNFFRLLANKLLKADSARFGEIPEDLIIEILLRLPVKSVLKFKCVSKSWCHVISSKQFVESQLNFATNNTNYVHILTKSNNLWIQYNWNKFLNISNADDRIPVQFYHPIEAADYAECIGSSNGLCAFRTKNRVFVWNPSTRKSRELPYIDDLTYLCWTHNTGFGFDGVDYKVLVMYRTVAKLYSSRINSWKTIPFDMRLQYYRGRVGKSANGKLYWIRRDVLFYFDLGTEVFGKLEPPLSSEASSLSLSLEVLGECLCLNSYRATGRDTWVLKHHGLKDEYSWNKIVTNDDKIPLCTTAEGKILYANSLQRKMFYDGCIRYVSTLVSPFPDESS